MVLRPCRGPFFVERCVRLFAFPSRLFVAGSGDGRLEKSSGGAYEKNKTQSPGGGQPGYANDTLIERRRRQRRDGLVRLNEEVTMLARDEATAIDAVAFLCWKDGRKDGLRFP